MHAEQSELDPKDSSFLISIFANSDEYVFIFRRMDIVRKT